MVSKEVTLDRPTEPLVTTYYRKFESSERYAVGDRAILRLVQQLPHNTDLDVVLLKVCIINDLYGTQIYSTFEMAQHIQSLNIDPELRRKSTNVVNAIAKARLGNKERNCYSFATKYCSWHDQCNYPIFDKFVEAVILQYRRLDSFTSFRKQDLKDYGSYKRILTDFRTFYGLQRFTFKELDKFLWMYGREKFPNI